MPGSAFRFHFAGVILTFLMLFNANPSNALSKAKTLDYDVKQWTSQNGLSSQSVRTISQDRLGYIWVGSLFGLNRFDGNRFEVFNTQNTRDLVSNAINKVFIDSTGYLWIGTKSGLSGVDPSDLTFANFKIREGVTDITETPNKEVLVAAGGLFRIVDKTITRVKEIKGDVGKIETSPEGTWVITATTLYLLKDDGLIAKTIALPERISQSIVHDLLWTESDGLYVATEIGAFRVGGEAFKPETLPAGKDIPVYKVEKDSRGGLWLSTMGNIFYRNRLNSQWQPMVSEHLRLSGWFADIFEDRDKNLWLANSSDGLWRASVSRISRHVPRNLPSTDISSVLEGPDGKLWLGTTRGVATMDKTGRFELVVGADALKRQNIYSMAFEDDKVLMGTERGLLVYENGKVSLPMLLRPLQWSNVKTLTRNAQSGFWIGSSMGLFSYKDGKFATFDLNGQFDSKSITYVMDKGNDTWIGTKRGVYRFDGNSLLPLGRGIGVYRSFITSILDLDDLGVLVSTLDDGLFFKSAHGGWSHYDESSGLANGVIVALHFQQSDKMIWVSTLEGIYRFEASQFDQDGGNIQIESILSTFDRQLGSAGGRCCSGVGHHKIARFGGSLWFPSFRGLVEVPEDIEPYGDAKDRSAPIIQKIVIGDRKIVIGTQTDFQLDLNERDFTVFYSTLNFKQPELETFRYKLEGYNPDWIDVEKRREAVFTNLPSGQFIFTVQTKYSNQTWPEAKETQITVKIPKQFNETMLYRILVGVLIMLVLYGVLLLMRNREKRKRATLRQLVDQRTSELQSVNAQLNEANQQLKQLSHKDELSGLRNRHFVFEQLPKDIEHYQRNRESMISQGKSFALIVINIDGFKHVNDSHGPIAGDSVLTQFAVLLTRETRGSDYVVRWGGDEFLIVLRDSQANQIESFIYELNLAVANGEFYLPDGQNVKVTCSIGYAMYPLELIGGQLINWEVSLSLADMALHQVKNAGRNGWATVEFDDQVDAFEFEDNDALEALVEQLFATGAARFNVRLADTNFVS
jgi:diguanylate cyclase (GGDEF)-like protein